MATHDNHSTKRVFYRRAEHLHPVAERGEGVYLYDAEGKRYIDASGGAIVVNAGHGVREIAEAMGRQAAQMAYAHPTMFTSRPLETYAEALAEVTPLPDVRFFPMSSGSEAIETAIKLARQVQVERGQAGRHLIIARWQSYHGATLGALAMTGKPKMRRPFQPMLPETPHIPPPYCYRCPYGLTHPDCGIRCAEALAAEIKRVGEENVAAFVAESVSGATLGAVVPPPEYWPRIRKICDEHGLLLIVDEVMAGFGRTGRWFGFQHWDIVPDLVTMGKGTTSGYFPLSVAAVRDGLADLACVGDVRGIGLMWGVEFVADRASKATFPPQLHFGQQVADAAFERGLIAYPGSGCADGVSGDSLMLGPPLVITPEQIDKLVALLRRAVDTVGGEAARSAAGL
jgi:adenosylmethionine-8-amino-7-oxononanoate aminotransferase